MNMRDDPIVHIDIDKSKGTACSMKGHGCK